MPIDSYCEKPAATIRADESVREAARRMTDERIGSLVVVEDGRPTGVVTDRDIVLETLCNRLDPGAVRVQELVSRPVVTIQRDRPVREAARLIRRHGLRRLPIVDEKGELVGIVTLDDLLSLAAAELSGLAIAMRGQAQRHVSNGSES